MTRKQIANWLAGGLLALGAGALVVVAVIRAMDLPPSDSESLAAIVQSVESKNLGAIRSVEYERAWWQLRGLWEITACVETCFKLYIDPRTGVERHRNSEGLEDQLPPPNTQGPSGIAKFFEDRKLGFITEIEFEHGAWQVTFREARGLTGALQPNKQRVFEPIHTSLKKEDLVPRTTPPVDVGPREQFPTPSREKLIRVFEQS
jgi:hypothetical protein